MLFNAIVDAAKWLDVLAGRGCKADNEFLLVLPVADQNAFLLVSDRVVKIRSSALATARRLNANNWKAARRTAADYFLIPLPPDVMATNGHHVVEKRIDLFFDLCCARFVYCWRILELVTPNCPGTGPRILVWVCILYIYS